MKRITVDENGCSPIITINGDDEAEVGSFASSLSEGDEVELEDGSTWNVTTIYSKIQTGQQGSGFPNYVFVDLDEID